MGSWDTSSFGNEVGEKWLVNLLSGESGQPIFKTLARAARLGDDEYLQVQDCEEIIAAAEVVAAAVGAPGADLPPEVPMWLSAHTFKAGSEIVEMALKMVDRIAAVSELKELWDDTDSKAEWAAVVADLRKRLSECAVYKEGQATKSTAPKPAPRESRSAEAVLEEALKLVSEGAHAEALERYNEAVNLAPGSQLAYLGRGTCHLSLGQYEDAINNFNVALNLCTNVPEAFYLRAQALFHLEQYDDCIQDLSQLINHNPKDWNAWWMRGLANQNLAQYLKATNDFTKVIELAPSFQEVYLHRAQCYEKLGSFDWASRDRERYERLLAQQTRG